MLCLVCLSHFFTLENKYPYTNYVNDGINIYDESISEIHSETEPRVLYSMLFNSRNKHYTETLKSLKSTINNLAILVLLGLMLLYFKPSDIKLFGINIPNLALYIILPVCILYYWLLFGFSLFSAIASRESLYHISINIENTFFDNGKSSVNPIHSQKNGLQDISIIDAWSNVFLGFYEQDYNKAAEKEVRFNYEYPAVTIGLFVIFGGLQALAMGTALLLIIYYKKRFAKESKRKIILFEFVIFTYFILSHFTFYEKMPYSTLYLASIWLFSSIFFLFTLNKIYKEKTIENRQ